MKTKTMIAVAMVLLISCNKMEKDFTEVSDTQRQLRTQDYGPFVFEDYVLNFESISDFETMVRTQDTLDSIGMDSVVGIIKTITDYTSYGEFIYNDEFWSTASDEEKGIASFNLDQLIYHAVNSDGILKIDGYFLKFDFENETCMIHKESPSYGYAEILEANNGDPELGEYTFDDEGIAMIKHHMEEDEWVYGFGCNEDGAYKEKSPLPYGEVPSSIITWQGGNQTTTNYRFRHFAAYHKYLVYFTLECQIKCEKLVGNSWVNTNMDMRIVGNRKYKPKCKTEKQLLANDVTTNTQSGGDNKLEYKPYTSTTALHKFRIYGTFSVPSQGWWTTYNSFSEVREPNNY